MLEFLKSRWKLIVMIAVILLAVGVSVTYLLGNKSTATANNTVTVAVRKGPIDVTVSGTGAVRPTITKSVKAKTGGTITKINVTNGQQVKQGDLLFQLSSDSIQSEIDKANLSVQQAQLDYDTAVANQNNQQNNNNSPQSGQNSSHVASLALKLQQAKLNLADAQNKLKDLTVYAPVDGVVTLGSSQSGQGNSGGASSANLSGGSFNNSANSSSDNNSTPWQVGDDVSSGQNLATITGTGAMTVTVPVDEVDLSKVKTGQKADITADALPDKKFTGTVTDIANEGTQSNGVARFNVTVSIDQPEGLKTNMTANVVIKVASKEDVLLLPIEAVQDRQGRKFVFQPNDSSGTNSGGNGSVPAGTGNNNSAMRRNMVEVQTGLYNETWIEITSGLQEGDLVILPNVTRSSGSGQNNSGNRNGFMGGGGIFSGGGNRNMQFRSGGFSGMPRD